MKPLTILAALSHLVQERVGRAMRGCARRLALAGAAATAALAAAGFAVAAIHLAMAEAWGSITASLVVAGGLAVIALVLGLLAGREPRRTTVLDRRRL